MSCIVINSLKLEVCNLFFLYSLKDILYNYEGLSYFLEIVSTGCSWIAGTSGFFQHLFRKSVRTWDPFEQGLLRVCRNLSALIVLLMSGVFSMQLLSKKRGGIPVT